MKEPKFKLADGQISAYAFGCGYLQQFSHGRYMLTMWHEGACYHVRLTRYDPERMITERYSWDCYESLTEARARFRKLKKQLKGTK
jgi:hypothetical protein